MTPRAPRSGLSRRELLGSGVGASAALAFPWVRRYPSSDAPNLVVITSDQQHWQALGSRDPFFQTPALDALSEESTSFTNAFCTSPQCSPSRASMMTGAYPHRTGVDTNLGPKDAALRLPTIGTHLGRAGYRTAYYGKWHLGRLPAELLGFDDLRQIALDSMITDQGRTFLRKARKDAGPFALFLMYIEPHGIQRLSLGGKLGAGDDEAPLDETWSEEDFAGKPEVHRRFAEWSKGRALIDRPRSAWEGYRREYRARVATLDEQVGAIVKLLKRLELWEDTAVLFTSDHGEMDTHHRLVFKGPLMYEHLVRVPLTIRLPAERGGSGPSVADHYAWSHVDLAPTLADLAGAELTSDGRSAAPLLRGEELAQRDFVVSQFRSKGKWECPVRMLRTSELKYVRYVEHGEELYDLGADPGEMTNLAADPGYAERKDRLAAALDRWMAENEDPFPGLTASPLGQLSKEPDED